MAGTREASRRRLKRLRAAPGAPLAGGGRSVPLVSSRTRTAQRDQQQVVHKQIVKKTLKIGRPGR